MVLEMREQISPKVSRLRSITSQIIACMSPNLLLMDLSMAVSFSTIAVPALLNSKDDISLNEEQASWFGSIAFLVQPLGALLSGPMMDYFGRKKANFLVNLPHIAAWILMYFAWNIPSLFVANALLGIGTGIMEAPVNSYVGEVTEPSIRGSLGTTIQVFYSLGMMLMYLLGTVVSWRHAALISLAGPLVAMCLVLFLPETPVWLLAQGREKEALKSLCYLRGWTTPENVQEEFDQLILYTKEMQECVICVKTLGKPSNNCEHKRMNIFKRTWLKFKSLMLCKETMRPFSMVVIYFFFFNMSGITPVRANMENVCRALAMSHVDKSLVLVVGVVGLIVAISLIVLVRVVGKRKLAIGGMFLAAVSTTGISVYAKLSIDDAVFSYDPRTFPKETSMVPLIFFYVMIVCTSVGMPWIILGEVYPFRSRASAQGITAALNYVIMFLASKTLIDLELHFHLWGTFAVYATLAYIGTIFLYLYLPETEGKSLEEIEGYYAENKQKIFADDCFANGVKRLMRRRKVFSVQT